MSDDFLKGRLRRVARRYQWIGFWRKLSACWALGALVAVGVVLLQRMLGYEIPGAVPILAALTGGVGLWFGVAHLNRKPDYRWVAQRIEKQFPELDGVLLTAVQQQLARPQDAGYLQYRVIQEATSRSQQQDWRKVVPGLRFVAAAAVQVIALGCFVYALRGLDQPTPAAEKSAWVGSDGLAVTPGDASVEKGESLVVLARFDGALPPSANLVVSESGSAPRTIPLVKSLADPVFGGSIPEVSADFTYHIAYRGTKTKEFKITVYEHPKLIRADVALTFPEYTKLDPKRVEDTRRVSAVEGTKLSFELQLNKPVKSAKLVSRESKGIPRKEIPLAVSADNPQATLADFRPEKSGVYELQLVDAQGRANKVATPFNIDVQPNRPPELKLVSPRGDLRPSALEEIAFDGTVWDDFGSPAYGLAYSLPGGEPKFIQLGSNSAAREKKNFAHLLDLEELKAKPDDLISWHLWADDIGPDGQLRRTNGDLYFAEVRAFDEIFRESQNMGGEGEGGGGQEARKLTDLQKQIINATWKLQREGKTPRYPEDIKVVLDSQKQALAQAGEAAEEARSPSQAALWRVVTQEMEKAIDKLGAASSDPVPLAEALPPEQAAYQALLKLQARETAITRRQRGGGGGGGGQNQRQIDQLELEQSENRYETQRLAKSPQNRERQEQQAVMNRLQELSRRQQDLNERLKELQTALQEAKTEKEREEIKRRLKRLQEEQQEMLADVDELKQRMERPENQSRMADERQQLEQTREDLQKASEAAQQGSVSQALASGTRAQRQLQEMRENMRKENSSAFAEDLREMRQQARDLARQQEQIGQKLDQQANSGAPQRRSLSDDGQSKELIDQLEQQKNKMNQLVERAQQVSEQAEHSEPLVSRQLYDSIRKVSQDDANAVKQAKQDLTNSGRMTRDMMDRLQQTGDREGGGKAFDVTQDLLREGHLPQAQQAGQNVRKGIDELRRGVERAAESVLGDDAEQLKLAQSELDALTEQLRRESAQAGNGQQSQPGQQGQRGQGNQPGQRPDQQAGSEPAASDVGDQPGQQPGERNGRGQQRPGDLAQAGQSPGQQQGETPQPGQGEQGQQPGQGQGKGQQPGQGSERSEQLAQSGQQGGQQPGQGQQSGAGQGQDGQQGQSGEQGRGQGQGGASGGGDRLADARNGRSQPGQRGNLSIDELMRRNGERGGTEGGREGGGDGGANFGGDFGGYRDAFRGGLWTGADFRRWDDRLRDVEDLLEDPQLRNEVAQARERARQIRREALDLKKPDWAVVNLQILKPLVEVRSRVAEELARRDSKDSLTPIDRDPVPNRYAESVRRYYEELGKDTPKQ